MKFGFGFGKRFGQGKLTPGQRNVLDRLERGELTADEAERLLGGGADVREWRYSAGDEAPEDTGDEPARVETEEEAKARELVERIAREVDEETNRPSP